MENVAAIASEASTEFLDNNRKTILERIIFIDINKDMVDIFNQAFQREVTKGMYTVMYTVKWQVTVKN